MSTEITKEISLKLEIVSIIDMLEERLLILDMDEETKELLNKISDEIHNKIHEDIFPLIDNICNDGSL